MFSIHSPGCFGVGDVPGVQRREQAVRHARGMVMLYRHGDTMLVLLQSLLINRFDQEQRTRRVFGRRPWVPATG